MLIHQIHNSLNSQIFNIGLYNGVGLSNHLHRGYELICVMEGMLTVNIYDRAYTLKPNDCILITPYQIHSFLQNEDSFFFITVFSESDIGTFAQHTKKKVTDNPVFTPSEETLAYVKSIFLPKDTQRPTSPRNFKFLPRPDTLSTKAALYAICAEYVNQCQFLDTPPREQAWIMDALFYIEEHFTSDISLHGMAKELGYNYEYLSREFNRTLGVNFKNLVNQYRSERARHLIKNTSDSLTDIASKSGFQSIRSFNRVFKEHMGILPSEMRKNIIASKNGEHEKIKDKSIKAK